MNTKYTSDMLACLQSFMVVHPTMWTKMTCWWFSTFMAPAIKNKIHNINTRICMHQMVVVRRTSHEAKRGQPTMVHPMGL